MATGANILEIVIRARDLTQKALTSVKTRISGLSGVLGKFGGAIKSVGSKLAGFLTSGLAPIIGVVGLAGLVMGLKNAVDTFGAFEQACANASSVTGATGQKFIEVKDHIAAVSKELGETTVFKASEAANAFYDLASAGYDVAEIGKKELKPVLDLAAATATELKRTTEITTSTLGQFGLTMQDSGMVADVFARTIGSSKATLEKLGTSLAYTGSVAHSLGMSLEETNGILGILYNKGYDASMAGTALRGAFTRLLDPTADMKDTLAQLGVTMEQVNPETHNFADILDTLTAAGMGTNEAMQLFGVRAGPAMLALTGNTDDIRELTAALNDAGGAAQTMAEQQLATFSGAMQIFQSKLESAAISIGAKFAPVIVDMATGLTDVLMPALNGAWEAIERRLTPAFEPLRTAAAGAWEKMSGGLAIGDLFKDLGILLGECWSGVAKVLGWVIDKLGPLWELIGWVVGGIHTLASSLKSEADLLDDLKDAVDKVNRSKEELIRLNERLNNKTVDLAAALKDAAYPMEHLNELHETAIEKEAAAEEARRKAIAAFGMNQDEYNRLVSEAARLDTEAKAARAEYNSEIGASAQFLIDHGLATDDVILKYGDLKIAEDEVAKQTAIFADNIETANEKENDLHGTTLTLTSGFSDAANAVGTFFGKMGEAYDKLLGAGLEAQIEGFKGVISAIGGLFVEEVPRQTSEAFDSMAAGIMATMTSLESDFSAGSEKMATATADSLGMAQIKWADVITQIDVEIDRLTAEYETASETRKAQIDTEIAKLHEMKDNATTDLDAIIAKRNELNDSTKEDTEQTVEDMIATWQELDESVMGTAEETQRYWTEQLGLVDAAIEAHKAAWITASESEREELAKTGADLQDYHDFVENNIANLSYDKAIDSVTDLRDATKDSLGTVKNAIKDVSVTIGDTEITFKGLAGEILNSIDSFEKLQNTAQTLLDMDWTVFERFEQSLPVISAGIKSMQSSFAGLKKTLEENVQELSSVKASVEDIADMVEPFISAGFLEGVESIGKFAGALTNIQSAINDFGSLTEVNTEACADFADSIDSMVYALHLLDNQMGDLMPAFHEMHGVIISIMTTFSEQGSVIKENEKLIGKLEEGYVGFTEKGWSAYAMIHDFTNALGLNNEAAEKLAPVWEEAIANTASMDEAITYFLADARVMPLVFDQATSSMLQYNEELKKITESLKPLIDFMNTLTAIVEFQEIPIEKLNTALQGIVNTLANFAIEIAKIDFGNIFEDLFGEIIEDAEGNTKKLHGAVTDFIKDVDNYSGDFKKFNSTLGLFTSSLSSIISLFEVLNELVKDTTEITFEDFDRALVRISNTIQNFTPALANNIDNLFGGLEGLSTLWSVYAEDMIAILPTVSDASSAFDNLSSSVITLQQVFTDLISMGDVSEQTFQEGFLKLIAEFENFSKAFEENIDEIIIALSGLREAWLAQEGDTVALMRAFVTIAKNFIVVISYALQLSEAFKALEANTSTIQSGMDTLVAVIKDITSALADFNMEAIDASGNVTAAIKQLTENIISILDNLNDNMFTLGGNLLISYVNGIYSKMGALITAMQMMAHITQQYLGIHSPAEKGALSELEGWGPSLVETYVKGIKSALPQLNAALQNMAAPRFSMPTAPNATLGAAIAGSSKQVNMNIYQTIDSEATARYAAEQIRRELSRVDVL